jgi:hypothetical protein
VIEAKFRGSLSFILVSLWNGPEQSLTGCGEKDHGMGETEGARAR